MKCNYCGTNMYAGHCHACGAMDLTATSKKAQISTQELVQNFSKGISFSLAQQRGNQMEAGQDFANLSRQGQIPTIELIQNFGAGVVDTQMQAQKSDMEAGRDFAKSHNAKTLKKPTNTKPKTGIGNYESSKARQGKHSRHLIASSSATDFGNSVLGKRWSWAESIATALLVASSLILVFAMFLPFFSGQQLLSRDDFLYGDMANFSGVNAMRFEFGVYSIIATTSIGLIVFGLSLLALSVFKLIASFVKDISFANTMPMSIALAVLSLLVVLFSIVCFATINMMIADFGFAGLLNAQGNAGAGIVLVMISSIAASLFAASILLSRYKLNKLGNSMITKGQRYGGQPR